LTSEELVKLNKCEDLLSGSDIAALKRSCLSTRSGRNERNIVKLKDLWCSDSSYRSMVSKCVQHKFKTMRASVYSVYRPHGTVTTGWKAIVSKKIILSLVYLAFNWIFQDCFRKTVDFVW